MKRIALFILLLLLSPAAYSKHIWLDCKGFTDSYARQFNIRIDEDNDRVWVYAHNIVGKWEYARFGSNFIEYSTVGTNTYGRRNKYRYSWRLNRHNGEYESFWQDLPDGIKERITVAICRKVENLY